MESFDIRDTIRGMGKATKPFDQTDVFHDKLFQWFFWGSLILLELLGVCLVTWLADHFLFKRFEAIFRWPAAIICAVGGWYLGFLLALISVFIFENTLDKMRKRMGRDPLGLAIRLHKMDEIERVAQIEGKFIGMDTNEKLLELFRNHCYLIKEQSNQSMYLGKQIRHLKYMIIALFFFLIVVLILVR